MFAERSVTLLSILIIIAGIVIILENYAIVEGLSRHWPVLLIIVGSGFIALFFQRGKYDLTLIWIGTFLLSVGILFYYLNFTSWNRLSKQWPFFMIFVGLSYLIVTLYNQKKIYTYLALSFTLIFILFFMIFSVSTKLWPVSLIFFGMSLLSLEFSNKTLI